MKLNWEKKKKIEETLVALSVSTGLEIYSEILAEIKSLWELESQTKSVMGGFPASDKQHYADATLGMKIKDRLVQTKKLIDMVGA